MAIQNSKSAKLAYSEIESVYGLFKSASKIAAPVTGVVGIIGDFLSPLMSLAPVIIAALFLVFLYCFLFW